MEELVALCKSRGFIFQSNEIYGGLQGVYDYGPLGVELKNNIKQAWWRSMVYERDDIEGLDASILTNPKVLKYSGHEETFSVNPWRQPWQLVLAGLEERIGIARRHRLRAGLAWSWCRPDSPPDGQAG